MGKKKESSRAPAWIVTFGDMMSLLLCFFIVLLSFSVMDKQKFVEVAGSLGKAFGIQEDTSFTGNPRAEKMVAPAFTSVPFEARFQREIMETISEEVKAGLVDVDEQDKGVVLRVKEVVAFDSGSATIKPDFLPFLDKLGKAVAKSDAQVVVSGHTDDRPLLKKTVYKSNWGLSAARAVSVVEYWEARYKIPPERLTAVAHASGRPVAPNTLSEGRARNRRVEFKIMPTKAMAFEGLSPISPGD
jgi:chemotaxis protein MotB